MPTDSTPVMKMVRCPRKRSPRPSSGGSGRSPSPTRRRPRRVVQLTQREIDATEHPPAARKNLPVLRGLLGSNFGQLLPSAFEGTPINLGLDAIVTVMRDLRDRCGMRGARAVFCDIGCGRGDVVLGAVEASPSIAGAIGFDQELNALVLAETLLRQFLAKTDSPVKVCLLKRDVTCLGTRRGARKRGGSRAAGAGVQIARVRRRAKHVGSVPASDAEGARRARRRGRRGGRRPRLRRSWPRRLPARRRRVSAANHTHLQGR